MSERLTLRLTIRGHVQGVGFRYAMHGEAMTRGVTGWVRNRRDGSVEALVQGPPEAVEAMRAWAAHGPPGASVSSLEAETAQGEFTRFDTAPSA